MPSQDDLYQDAIFTYGPALERLAKSYEADLEDRQDLLQEIHLAIWRSFETFDGRCSIRTWVYRVAHNAAASHVIRSRRMRSRKLVSLEDFDNIPCGENTHAAVDRNEMLGRVFALIQKLNPLDRQVILLYLEGLDADSIGEVTGISPGNAAIKVHRIKNILARQFQEEVNHAK